ncbi:MAG TPA: bifunctional DNA primase/polymerase [Pseudonocardia sp.]|jgi:hypothetical protein
MSSWWTSSRAVYGAELRAGALCLVDHGWPVVPGTWWQDSGPADCAGWDSVPSVPQGVAVASTDPVRVAGWWAEAPYSVLVATGAALDVVEVPAWMGRRMTCTLRAAGEVVPLAATPAGRWWFPVRVRGGELPDAVVRSGALLHGAGSWVIAPPSEAADGLVHWRVNPSVCGWRLPDARLVHWAAAEAARWRAEHDLAGIADRLPAVVGPRAA